MNQAIVLVLVLVHEYTLKARGDCTVKHLPLVSQEISMFSL